MPARKAAKAKALPQSKDIPQGMKQMGGGYAPTWKPENEGDTIHGVVTEGIKVVEFTNKRKVKGKLVEEVTERRVIEVTQNDSGERFAVWESAALVSLFDEIEEKGAGHEVYIRYDGLGKKKPGQNAPKLFTVAMAE